MRILFITATLLLSQFSWADLGVPNVAEQIKFPVEKFKLENGLTVLLHEDHSAPIISYHQWFRVGSRNEKPGRTGLAHFFEHLMFKGTKKFPGEKFKKIIQGNGGRNNAFTSRDYTGYYTNLPSGTLELIIDVESDRMKNLGFKLDEIKSEREVVKEERRMRVENSVSGMLMESLFRTVYKVHPYKWPVIGYMKDLNAASLDDLKNFYRIYYAPNNTVVVIAGDFDAKKAKKLMTKHYGSIPKQPLPKLSLPREPTQAAPREVTRRKDVQAPTFAVSFMASKAGDKDSYALDLLSSILGDGSSSRLYKRLVYREQRATSASSWAYTIADPGVFTVSVSLKPGQNVEKPINSVYNELYKFRKKLVSEKEIQKAKTIVMKSYVDSLKTIGGKARALAINEIYFEDYSEMFKDIDKYNAVTREEIMAVANKYLTPQKRSVIKILPKKKKEGEAS